MPRQLHTIPPVFDPACKILILGSFPSVKSREIGFYYGHPQNRFWQVIAAVTNSPVPKTVADKKALLLEHHIAVWDVIESCEITGSSDSSIKKVEVNRVDRLLQQSQIQKIFVNGQTAGKLYQKYLYPLTNMEAVLLPSTSPANAAFTKERLTQHWKIIADYSGRRA